MNNLISTEAEVIFKRAYPVKYKLPLTISDVTADNAIIEATLNMICNLCGSTTKQFNYSSFCTRQNLNLGITLIRWCAENNIIKKWEKENPR